jgi:hypothetical protein
MPLNSHAEALSTVVNSDEQPFTTAVLRALDRLRLTDKELAAFMKLLPSQWSAQKAGRGSNYMHVQRVDVLPAELRDRFLDALLDELAHSRGRVIATPQGHLKHIADAAAALSKAIESLAVASPVTVTVRELPLLEARRA